MPRRGQAFLSPWQVVDQGYRGIDRLLGFLPRWLQGPRSQVLAGAIGRQVDAIRDLGVADQLFVATATWGLAFAVDNPDGTSTPTGWERDYGLKVQQGDSYAIRRLRVLGRMRGGALRTVADFATYAAGLLGDPPKRGRFGTTTFSAFGTTAYSTYGEWVVFKPAKRGFPGNFRDVEDALALAGPAHIGLFLAPHRESPDTGLTIQQLGMLRIAAVGVLTIAEIGGL